MNGHLMVELPVDIAVEELPDGVRYRLPVRQWPSRWSGWVLLFVGMAMVAVAIALGTWASGVPFVPGGAVLAAVSLVIAGIGLLLCLWGQSTLSGYAEITLSGEQLRATEVTGHFRWSRKRATSDLTCIHIMHEWQGNASAAAPLLSELTHIAYRIVLEYEGGRRRVLVKWYAREHLQPIAHDLAERLGLSEAVQVQQPPDPNDQQKPIEQPAGSAITLEHTPDGLTAVIPPLGILRSEDGRSVTRLVGGGVAGALAGMVAMIMFGVGPWWMWAIFSVPAFMGVVSVTTGLLGQRDTYIDIVGDTLLISTRGWRGVRQHQWSRVQLSCIIQGESVVEINDENLPQLHIVPEVGETVRLLTGRSRDEILWLAHVLREALAMDEPDDADAASKTGTDKA